MKLCLFLLQTFLLFSSEANDTTASTPGHDLILEKTPDIRMKKEVLRISPKKVSVDYIYLNEGKTDLETTVAFPLGELWNGYHGSSGGGEYQFDDFRASVDGKNVTLKIKPKALLWTQSTPRPDLTHELTKLNIPNDRFLELKKIPPTTLEILKEKGWYSENNPDQEMQAHYTLQNTYYWVQKFPKGKESKSHHEYTPELGGDSVGQLHFDTKRFWGTDKPDAPGWDQFHPKDNILYSEGKCGIGVCGPYRGAYFIYILSTGSNWKNGIEDFDLQIDGASLILVDIDGRLDFDLGSYHFKKIAFKPTAELRIEYVGVGHKPVLTGAINFEKEINGPGNCRKNPNGETVLSIRDKEKVILRERQKDWYRVEYQKKECWTHRKNLRFLPEASS